MNDHATPPPGLTHEHLARHTHRRWFYKHEFGVYHVMPDGIPQDVYKLRGILRSVPDRIYAYVDASGAVMLTGSTPELEPYPSGMRLCSVQYVGTLVCALSMLSVHNHVRIRVEDNIEVSMDKDRYVVLAGTAINNSPKQSEIRLCHQSKMEHYIDVLADLHRAITT